jgi:hypothetical protein
MLDAEARARAGDPGLVPLRRLSNAEYDATIRDLTGVDDSCSSCNFQTCRDDGWKSGRSGSIFLFT